MSLRYHGTAILDAIIRAEDADGDEVKGAPVKLQRAETADSEVEQRLKFLLDQPQEGVELVLRGTVLGTEEAFPAETRSETQDRFPYVRNTVGLSHNLRNNAVYHRRWDWVLIGPADGATRIQPKLVEEEHLPFSWESRGLTIEILFRPRFDQKHKMIERFEPWTYEPWRSSVSGYCTWWAYRGGFSQETLHAVVDTFAEKNLPDFGYRYLQLDDCYQTGNGSSPKGFLTWNNRFPGGWEHTTKKIRSPGMQPGIWVHRVHRANDRSVQDIFSKHPDWFVHEPDGELFTTNGFYSLNTHEDDALEAMARQLYRPLKRQGWDHVKIDGAGDLFPACQQQPEDFQKIHPTPGETLRRWDQDAREELGPDVYILSCWGVLPGMNVVGLVDGCRLGSDGFGPAEVPAFQFLEWSGLAQ